MTGPNGSNGNRPNHSAVLIEGETTPAGHSQVLPSEARVDAEPVTRAKLRARQRIQQNRIVIVAAGAVVFALLVFAIVSAPRVSNRRTGNRQNIVSNGAGENNNAVSGTTSAEQKSLLPINDSGRPLPKETHDGYLSEQDLERSGTRRAPSPSSMPPPQSNHVAGTLGSIPPFGEQPWQAPPYQPGMTPNVVSDNAGDNKTEHDAWNKASLVFVRNASAGASVPQQKDAPVFEGNELGLPVGTRLRARLESAASTAVRTPVLAVIEYNYERDGEILVPAGAKAVGQIQEADRSGYMRIEFDSLMLPDGSTIPIHAAATDLEMRPVKGKVEGKNTGKNVLVRSLSGIGQASTMLLGRGSLNAPLSESDLIRERISNNIGEASDEQISRLAITARIVVTVSAGTDVYVVLEKSAASAPAAARSASQARAATPEGLDQLRQLLQLQQELNQAATK